LDGFDAVEEEDEVESDKEMGLDDEEADEINNYDPQKFAEVCCFILT
jgi:importin-7